MKTSRSARRRNLPTSPFAPAPDPVLEEFSPGELVTHDKYGLGRVLEVQQHAIIVDFGPQKLRLAEPYARLFKL